MLREVFDVIKMRMLVRRVENGCKKGVSEAAEEASDEDGEKDPSLGHVRSFQYSVFSVQHLGPQ